MCQLKLQAQGEPTPNTQGPIFMASGEGMAIFFQHGLCLDILHGGRLYKLFDDGPGVVIEWSSLLVGLAPHREELFRSEKCSGFADGTCQRIVRFFS